MKTHPLRSRPQEIDLDSTDELPVLDLKQIAGTERAEIVEDDTLSSTDTFVIPALPAEPVAEDPNATAVLEPPVVTQLSPISTPIQELQGAPVASTADNDVSGIFDTIRSLEANLRAHAEREIQLQAQLKRALADRAAFEQDMAEAQRRSEAVLESLQTLETRRRVHDDVVFEMDNELQVHVQRIAAVETQLEEREKELTTLKAQMLEERARLSALSEEKGGQIAQLQEQSTQKSVEIAALVNQKRELEKELNTQRQALEKQLQQKIQQLSAAENTVADQAAQIRTLQEQGTQKSAEVSALAGQKDELQKVLTKQLQGLEKQLKDKDEQLAAAQSAAAEQDAQIRTLHELSVQKSNEVAALVEQKDELQKVLTKKVQSLEAQLQEKADQFTAAQNAAIEQGEWIRVLQEKNAQNAGEIEAFNGQKEELEKALTSQLQSLESQLQQKTEQLAAAQNTVTEQAAQIRTLQETLTARDTSLGRLEAELKNSNEIIGSIQRDIRRLSIDAPPVVPVVPVTPAPAVAVDQPAAASAAVVSGEQPAKPVSIPKAAALAPPRRVLVQLDCEPEVTHVLDKPLLTVGRTEENDLALGTKFVSRYHARIICAPNFVVLEDLNSTNGSFINGRRVKRRHALTDGDLVIIGKIRFRFVIQNPA